MKLICIGDSLTYGNVGYSYRDFLNKYKIIVNKGKNGETLKGTTHRIKKYFLNQMMFLTFLLLELEQMISYYLICGRYHYFDSYK